MTRRLLAALLILLVAASATALGHARGQARIAGEVLLCEGSAVTSVAVDVDGHPVEHPVICPDMALALLAGFDRPAPDLPQPVVAMRALEPPPAPALRHGGPAVVQRARGPPVPA